MRLLIVIPAYNEAENIARVIEELKRTVPEYDYLIVNDGSKDNTAGICRENGYNCLELPLNLGIGGAVQAGYLYARENGYDIAVQFDGDGQHDAGSIPKLAEVLEKGEADIAIGSRFIDREGFQSSGARRAGIGMLSKLIRMLCGVKVLDVNSGMRAVNRRFIEEYAEHYAQDYPEPEAILYAGLRGAVIREVPVRMKERQGGQSSISPMKSVYYMIKVSLALLMGKLKARKDRKRGAGR